MSGWQKKVAPPDHEAVCIAFIQRDFCEGRITVERLEERIEKALCGDVTYMIGGLPVAYRPLPLEGSRE